MNTLRTLQMTTIDNHARVPDAGYIRTDAEVAHQANYEARERKRGRRESAMKITYGIVEMPARDQVIKRTCTYVVVRTCNGAEERSAPFYRQQEAATHIKEAWERDRVAAKRLGVDIHVTVLR
jgi:hypothetical protein